MVELPQLPASRLVVGDLLGEGGMARVYRAWHVETGQWCAVKVLREGVKPRMRQRFLREGALMCRLSHRNVLRGWELSDVEPPFLVMDLAEGGSLKGWVDRHGAMQPRLAVDVAIQICKGVANAHRAAVIHRDIKPHNVLIARKGVCKLTDFGIARIRGTEVVEEDPSGGGDAMGTLGYMAPEQQSNPSSADVRCDVYGVGATLYHLLKGRTPPTNLFAAGEYPETFEGLPEVLIPIVRKAVAYRADDRHATAQELARALHDTWKVLPDPLADGATLMTGMPPELPPPPGMVSGTPHSAPGRKAWPLRDVPTLDDGNEPSSGNGGNGGNGNGTGAVSAGSTPSVLEASDFRRSLMQNAPPPAEPAPQRTRWWIAVPALVAIGLALALADYVWVISAQQATDTAVRNFLDLARRDLSVVDELGSLGADHAALMAGYEAVRGTSGVVARGSAADAWLDSLAAASAASSGHPDGRTRAVAARRIEDLRAARDGWREAQAEWTGRAGSIPGRLVIVTGLAPEAPPPGTGGGDR